MLGRSLVAGAGRRVIGYSRTHPVYSTVFEEHPPAGFVYYRTPRWRPLRSLHALAWNRICLFHHDASAQLPPLPDNVPVVVSCEGRPHDRFFSDPRVRHVFVHSRWAGGDRLERGEVELLRLAPPIQRPRASRRNRNEIVILAVGLGGMVKGLDVAIRAFEALRVRFPIRLIIAGALGHNAEWYPEISLDAYKRIDFDELGRRVQADDRITLRQFTRRELLRAVYPRADIYLQLSRMDTYPFALLEAMSFGLPIVATRLNSIPEMVRDGETGFLIDHDGLDMNSADWADRAVVQTESALERLLMDPALRQRMGDASRARLGAAFDIDYARARLAQAYTQILGTGGSRPAHA
ncbi:MAG TPA: glycosyltransferase family 4 protein [Vicinamibacterales bacterium]|nr:glycosyltransferase family 4 protein [Vicinamibacterales bacterium]